MEAIHVQTQEEYYALMIHLDKKGYKWNSGHILTEYDLLHSFSKNREESCVRLSDNKITQFPKPWGIENGYTIITFKQYMERENKDTFTRGEVVMVRNNDFDSWQERIYVTAIEGSGYPYISVYVNTESNYKEGKEFTIDQWKQIKKKEETVTITLSKSDHEKVKQLLNI